MFLYDKFLKLKIIKKSRLIPAECYKMSKMYLLLLIALLTETVDARGSYRKTKRLRRLAYAKELFSVPEKCYPAPWDPEICEAPPLTSETEPPSFAFYGVLITGLAFAKIVFNMSKREENRPVGRRRLVRFAVEIQNNETNRNNETNGWS